MLRPLLSVLATLVLSALVAGSALAAPSGGSAASGPAAATVPAAAARDTSLELGIVRELNRVRAQHGLASVKVAAGLTNAAVGHSASMLQTGVFDHTSADGTTFDRRVQRSYPVKGFAAWTVGENLLYDSGSIDAAAAVEAWMNSPAHRDNMLNASYREVGVGALEAASAPGDFGGEHVMVITLDFGARTPLIKARRR